MLNQLFNKFTKGFTEIPLFYVTLVPNDGQEIGEKGSYETKLHPTLSGDNFVVEKLNDLIDHIQTLSKNLTNENKEVPLFYVTFNLKKYKEFGEKGSCDLMLHPLLKGDEFIVNQLNGLVDYIRKNFDMEDLSK